MVVDRRRPEAHFAGGVDVYISIIQDSIVVKFQGMQSCQADLFLLGNGGL